MSIKEQPNPNIIPRYCGLSTFARLPSYNDINNIDIGIIGIPFDGGCTYRTGARFGPEAIRKSSRLLRSYNPSQDIYPFKNKQVVDMGDIPCTPFNNSLAVEQIYNQLSMKFKNINNAIFLGGDHTISYPILRCINEKYNFDKGVTLIHFDSHLDTWEEYFDEKITHGTPFKRAFDEKLINIDTSIHVGIRGTVNDEKDFSNDENMGFKIIHCSDVCNPNIGIDGIANKIKNRVLNTPCYISIDIDVVDPAFAPGTGTPECGGFSSLEILTIIRKLKGINIIGGDVVEVAPCYDNNDNTSLLAATLSYELICLLQNNNKT